MNKQMKIIQCHLLLFLTKSLIIIIILVIYDICDTSDKT